MPTTSKPRSANRAAVTDESTPPDIATTMRCSAGLPSRSRSSEVIAVRRAPSARNRPRAGRRGRNWRRARQTAPPRHARQTARQAHLRPRAPRPGTQIRHTSPAIRGTGSRRDESAGRPSARWQLPSSRQCTEQAPPRGRADHRPDRGRARNAYRRSSPAPPARQRSPLPRDPNRGNSRYAAQSRHRALPRRDVAPGASRPACRICRPPTPKRAQNAAETDSPAPGSGENTPPADRRRPAASQIGVAYKPATPPPRPRPGGGRARPFRDSAEKQIAGRRGQLHGQPVELLGDDDLTAEPRRLGQIEGEVEHVVLIQARLLQQIVPLGVDDDVTGR